MVPKLDTVINNTSSVERLKSLWDFGLCMSAILSLEIVNYYGNKQCQSMEI